jgi:hypothetical protein
VPNVSTDVSFGLQTGAHLTARRTDASCISLDTVLISPSIEAGPLPGARIAGRVPGRLHRRTDARERIYRPTCLSS